MKDLQKNGEAILSMCVFFGGGRVIFLDSGGHSKISIETAGCATLKKELPFYYYRI